jgi:alkaline phosphatase
LQGIIKEILALINLLVIMNHQLAIFVVLKKKEMKTFASILIIASFIVAGCRSQKDSSHDKHPKNIILMIGDGMDLAQIYAGMTVNHGHLNMEKFKFIGLSKTYSASDYITDSGASGTAIATGQKTYNKAIGVSIDSIPLKTILEIAEENGLSTGLVVTSSILDATPAAFVAHQKYRDMYDRIANDLIHSGIDLFIGGGRKYLENRSDGANLIDSLRIQGYQVAYDTSVLKMYEAGKIAALLADDDLPRISEGRGNMLSMATAIAINNLSRNKKGFFMMVEGSEIDKACHDLNQEDVILETIDFDKAVGKVLEFAEKNGNTLVIVTADHETSGIALTNGDFKAGTVEMKFAGNFHTGIPVPVFAYGPGAKNFTGFYENTDIFKKMVQAFGFAN